MNAPADDGSFNWDAAEADLFDVPREPVVVPVRIHRPTLDQFVMAHRRLTAEDYADFEAMEADVAFSIEFLESVGDLMVSLYTEFLEAEHG